MAMAGRRTCLLALPLLLSAFCPDVEASGPRPKHIVALLADDFGWANTGWHASGAAKAEVSTPNMDALVAQGVELDRMYSYKFCSPSRSAIQSGRSPIFVNVQNLEPTSFNAEDLVSGYSGIPRNMTSLAQVLKRAQPTPYATHFVGKWDCGMATDDHTPQGRGYDTSLGYFHHMNDCYQLYYDSDAGKGNCSNGSDHSSQVYPKDLWQNSSAAPASLVNPPDCIAYAGHHSQLCQVSEERVCGAYPGFPGRDKPHCTHEEDRFAAHVLEDILPSHSPATPLFLFWAFHITHAPLQVPGRFLDRFASIPDWRRRRYAASVAMMDEHIGALVDALKDKGMWNDTLVFMSSDNGGAVYRNGSAGANNFPLRGGKTSNWEGGIRVNAFVSGGALPGPAVGTRRDGLTAVWDWYATMAEAAGITDIFDQRAAKAGLPPVDSISFLR